MLSFRPSIRLNIPSNEPLALRYQVISSLSDFQPKMMRFELHREGEERAIRLHEAAQVTDKTYDSEGLSIVILEKAAAGYRLLKRHYPSIENYLIPVLLQDLSSEGFVKHVLAMHQRLGLQAGELTLSFSERDPSKDIAATTKNIQKLMAAGINIDLNHFGSGLTGLFYLLNVPVSFLTLDASLTRRLQEESTQHLLKMVVESSAAMNVRVICDGVDQVTQHDVVQAAGCEMASGGSLPAIEQRTHKSQVASVTNLHTRPILKAG